jgi:hypothetical protein
MKKIFFGTSSEAAKYTFPEKLNTLGAASLYHGDEIQRIHHNLTGCQWSLGC